MLNLGSRSKDTGLHGEGVEQDGTNGIMSAECQAVNNHCLMVPSSRGRSQGGEGAGEDCTRAVVLKLGYLYLLRGTKP